MGKSFTPKDRLHKTKVYKSKNTIIELPDNFDWKVYLELNPDIKKQGFSSEKLACEHYDKWGKAENRLYTKEAYSTRVLLDEKQIGRENVIYTSTRVNSNDVISTTKKELTIIIPNKNGQTPSITINSLYKQTLRNFDIIIINDNDGNANKARNEGLKLVQTPYVLFSDNDIEWNPTAIKDLHNCLQMNPDISIAYGSYDIGGKIQSNIEWDESKLRKRNYISTMSMVRTKDHPGFDNTIQRLQDWDVWLTMLSNNKKGRYVNKLLFSTAIRNGITNNTIPYDVAEKIIKTKHKGGNKMTNLLHLNLSPPKNIQHKPISIMVTAYQVRDYIEECLDSIESQTYLKKNNKFEVLVGVDSCQSTIDKLEEIKHKYRNLKIIYMEENVGTYIVTNTLIDNAKYENVLRFDSDDIMKPDLIENVFVHYDSADVIRLGYNNFRGTIKYLEQKNMIAHGIVFFKRFVLDEIAGGYQPWTCGADTELIKRIENKVKIINLKSTFYRRQHDNNLTNSPETNFSSEVRKNNVKKIKKSYYDFEIKIDRIIGKINKIWSS